MGIPKGPTPPMPTFTPRFPWCQGVSDIKLKLPQHSKMQKKLQACKIDFYSILLQNPGYGIHDDVLRYFTSPSDKQIHLSIGMRIITPDQPPTIR